MLQIDTFVTIFEKTIIAEGDSGALIKCNQEQKKKKGSGGMHRGKGSRKNNNNNNNNKRKWNDRNECGGKEGENKKKIEVYKKYGKNHTGPV